MSSLNREPRTKLIYQQVKSCGLLIFDQSCVCFKHSMFRAHYNMKNISFNFITQVVCRLEIQGIKSGLLTDIHTSSAQSKHPECGKYLRGIPWLWLQKDAPGGLLFTEFPSEKCFYKCTALFH